MVYVEKHTKHPLIMPKNNNNSVITATAILAQTLIAVVAMALVTLANAQTPFTDAYLAKKSDTFNSGTTWIEIQSNAKWRGYTEQELNLRQDARNLFYASIGALCLASMNNNGNDQVAVSFATTLSAVALFDNVKSVIRRNKKLNQ